MVYLQRVMRFTLQSYYAMNGNHIEEIEFEARRNVHINHDYLCLRE